MLSRPSLSSLSGPALALLSAVLFGISPPLSKLVIGNMSPLFLAGLLYLGSGIGLMVVLVWQKVTVTKELARLSMHHRMKLLGAIISGGILAPVCLTYGIKLATAFEVSLLLNLESVTTTILAWLIFHEHIGKQVWIGKFALIFGALIITINPANPAGFSTASFLILGACLFWGIDNNLTRDIEELPPAVLAGVKGLSAGIFNITLALLLEHSLGAVSQMASALIIGALSYGASLVLFVKALRAIGTSRTSTYFAISPFFGMVFSLLLLGERPPMYHWLSATIMAAGLWFLSREHHRHLHSHEPIRHRHSHSHDEHHQHRHEENKDNGETHDHPHTHEPITHSHVHWPDIHHRHRH